jgi:hypothetical protein
MSVGGILRRLCARWATPAGQVARSSLCRTKSSREIKRPPGPGPVAPTGSVPETVACTNRSDHPMHAEPGCRRRTTKHALLHPVIQIPRHVSAAPLESAQNAGYAKCPNMRVPKTRGCLRNARIEAKAWLVVCDPHPSCDFIHGAENGSGQGAMGSPKSLWAIGSAGRTEKSGLHIGLLRVSKGQGFDIPTLLARRTGYNL